MTTYLIDTNVLSESTRKHPDESVVVWLRKNERALVVDPIILGEIESGILILPKGRKRRNLEIWLEEIAHRMVCVSWDIITGRRWARLIANLRIAGKAMSIKDSMIAASALRYDFTIATRNTQHFVNAGVPLVNPFD
ncbi:MAG TPA: PIN domain-containing protein [Chthoniobacterales bacterium]